MPRKPRFYLPGVPVHVIQRGNCRQAVFFEDTDCHAYLGWLKEGADNHGCQVHAYVLMTEKSGSKNRGQSELPRISRTRG